MKFPIGVDDFKKLIQGDYDYIDKTLFIQEILNDGSESLLIIRPRRFGKTLNMSMLKYFFDIQDAKANRALFKNAPITTAKTESGKSCMDFQGKFPVIFLTMKSVKAPNYDQASQAIKSLVSDLYKQHYYLLSSEALFDEDKKLFHEMLNETASILHLQKALKQLSEYLYRHHGQKVIILLDEYDAPMHASYVARTPYHHDMIDFMKIFLGEAFKGNIYLEKGVLTGILRVSLMNLFSGMNNIPVRTVLVDKYADCFGFTQDEVDLLLDQARLKAIRESVKEWYDGYQIGDTNLYNPWSIINCLDNQGTLKPYWLETGEEGILGKTLKASDINVKTQLEQLIQGNSIETIVDERTIFADLERNANALWGLLLFAGYLKVIGSKPTEFETLYQLAIPNQEVMGIYKIITSYWFSEVIGPTAYEQLFNSLASGSLLQFQDILQDYLDESASYYDFNRKTLEQFYHIFILGMLFVLRDRFDIRSNQESGYGRYDLALIPKKPDQHAVLFEFKVTPNLDQLEQTAQAALDQIDQKRYNAQFKKIGVKKAIHIGIAFSGKSMRLLHKQINI
ncbi:MAG: AAA family ATPase [Gammaproteobacteria bacterium]|nr:AAA family ATPase [Gammaproteobacteria bacterium]